MPEDLRPARRNIPDPPGGWSAADVPDTERVDDEFIAADSGRVFEPLAPEDERLFPPVEEG